MPLGEQYAEQPENLSENLFFGEHPIVVDVNNGADVNKSNGQNWR